MIKEIIEMLIILLIGTNTNQPKYDLRRKVKPSFSAKFYRFVGRHLNIILPVVIVLSLIAFIIICFAICGVSATGDGIYNGMSRVI